MGRELDGADVFAAGDVGRFEFTAAARPAAAPFPSRSRPLRGLRSTSWTASRTAAERHVVAVCARRGGGLVITSDPDDIARLAAAVPAARVVTRQAR